MSNIAGIKLDRRTFVRGSLILGAASPFLLSACSSEKSDTGGSSAAGNGGTINWLTWSDHYSNDQLAKVASSTKITGNPKLFSDNADAFLQLINITEGIQPKVRDRAAVWLPDAFHAFHGGGIAGAVRSKES